MADFAGRIQDDLAEGYGPIMESSIFQPGYNDSDSAGGAVWYFDGSDWVLGQAQGI